MQSSKLQFKIQNFKTFNLRPQLLMLRLRSALTLSMSNGLIFNFELLTIHPAYQNNLLSVNHDISPKPKPSQFEQLQNL